MWFFDAELWPRALHLPAPPVRRRMGTVGSSSSPAAAGEAAVPGQVPQQAELGSRRHWDVLLPWP